MLHSSPARWLAALLAMAALTVAAQTTPAPLSAPATSSPSALPFRSALDGYQSFGDEKAIPWKEANELVYRRGGWRAYAKEAAEGSKEGASTSSGVDPHAGHSMPGPKKEQP